MKTPVYIYGAGGLGWEVLSFLVESDLWEPAGFIDDGIAPGTVIKGTTVLGGMDIIHDLPKPSNLILAFGEPQLKFKIKTSLGKVSGLHFPTLVHPRATLQDKESIHLGEGSMITAGCILTTDIRIGDHVLVNLNCTLGHHVEVGDYASIMPGVNLAGQVKIGPSVLVGSGANILNGIKISEQSKVGAGAVVTRDVPPRVIVMGVPARIKK